MLKKAIPDFFNDAIRKIRFSDRLHFQWLIAIENVGTSLYRLAGCGKTRFFNSLLVNNIPHVVDVAAAYIVQLFASFTAIRINRVDRFVTRLEH